MASLPPAAQVAGTGLLQLFVCIGAAGNSDCLDTWDHDAEPEVVRLVDHTGPGATGAAPPETEVCPDRNITGWKELADYPSYNDWELDSTVARPVPAHHQV